MTRMMPRVLVLLCLVAPATRGNEPDRYDRFFDRVKPVLDSRCVSCHGPDKKEGKLRLDSAEGLAKGGVSGPAIDPEDPNESLILKAVRHDDDVSAMPPKERLRDDQISDLVAWVCDGAPWPEPARVLVDEDAEIVSALVAGEGSARVQGDRASGESSVIITGQKQADRIPGWNFPVREHPKAGEYRYARFAWKKRGGGGMMIEFARDGGWRDQGQTNASWVAGANTTGWPAIIVADEAPGAWTVVTRDLWADGGSWVDWSVTGLCVTSIDGGEVGVDSMVLGPTIESLDAYKPGRGLPAFAVTKGKARLGDAWVDAENPIRKIFRGERLDLWSLKGPTRPAVPEVRDSSWVRTPVDRFVLARLEAKGLAPSPGADRRTLIRRLMFDLHGLPPAPEEVRAFVEDPAADAYERLVERLLASPRYGERWGRHWLDVARYADSNGYERDEFRPTMWRYRDYVIRAFNDDKPYDAFVREQLAGDELAEGRPADAKTTDFLIATGFLRAGPWDSTKEVFKQQDLARDEVLVDMTETTAATFLGQTLACCRCHDHKNDPFSHDDNYRMRAFFAATKPTDHTLASLEGREEVENQNAVIDRHVQALEAERQRLVSVSAKRLADSRTSALPEAIRALLDQPVADGANQVRLAFRKVALEISEDRAIKAFSEAEKKLFDDIGQKIAETNKQKAEAPSAWGMTDKPDEVTPTFVLVQGDHKKPKHEVLPGFPSVLDPNPAEVKSPESGRTTGRRLTLAEWVVSPTNPWTARVMVNRIWMHHFGRGIVATPDDFGFSGARPTHPELLDWLSVEFRERGWSIKSMHRLIVLSSAYRQASVEDESRHAIDPGNALLWRQNPRRLDAESLRDALLSISGRLLPKESGPPLWPAIPREVLNSQPSIYETTANLQGYYTDPADATDVRSVFLVRKRAIPLPFLQTFDAPDPNGCVGRRQVTTVAPQALVLMNNSLSLRLAEALATRLEREEPGSVGLQLRRAFELAFGRAPKDAEAAILADHLARLARLHAGRLGQEDGSAESRHAALVDACRALINTNEFLTID